MKAKAVDVSINRSGKIKDVLDTVMSRNSVIITSSIAGTICEFSMVYLVTLLTTISHLPSTHIFRKENMKRCTNNEFILGYYNLNSDFIFDDVPIF